MVLAKWESRAVGGISRRSGKPVFWFSTERLFHNLLPPAEIAPKMRGP